MVVPGGQMGESPLSVLLNGPTPGFAESSQVHSHSAGEGLSIQVHLSSVVAGEVAHLIVASKNLLKGTPAKPLLQLHEGRKVEKSPIGFVL